MAGPYDINSLGVKQIIRGTITVTTGAGGNFTGTATIPAVNTARSTIQLLTSVGYTSGGTSNSIASARVDLTSSTQVTAYINDLLGPSNNPVPVGFQVVEYY